MTATADQIARLRRMVAEPTATTYSDADLKAAIERNPLADANTELPFVVSSMPQEPNPAWIPTYDLNRAAAEIWLEKAGQLTCQVDFRADGLDTNDSQRYQHAMKQYRTYWGRRSGRAIVVHIPSTTEEVIDANL